LLRKPEGKGAHGRPRHRWEDNIKMDLQTWDGGMYWIDLAQGQVAGSCKHTIMNLLVPQNGGNFLTS